MVEDLASAIGLDVLLAPLPGETPVGVDLRLGLTGVSVYSLLRDARFEARQAEKLADGSPGADTTMPPAWRSVRQLAVKALSESTKDLEIATMLTEALLRIEGIVGFAVGAQLMSGLVKNFWGSGLYPIADEEGVATRVLAVTSLNGVDDDGTLVQPLRKQVFFRRPDGTPIAFFEFDAAVTLQGEADPKKRQAKIAKGVNPFDELDRDAKAADTAGLVTLRSDLQRAITAWGELDRVLTDVAGTDAPPTRRIRSILEGMLTTVTRYTPRREEMPEIEGANLSTAAPATGPGANSQPVRRIPETREDMLAELTRIADFFRRTEPHSPLAYTLDNAVRRGGLSLPDLLAEIVPNAELRANMLGQLGIRPPPPAPPSGPPTK
jgi:type VI secretion system protein ImpA